MNKKIKTALLETTCNITTGNLDSNQAVSEGKYPFFTCAPDPLKIDSFAFEDSAILIAGNNAKGIFHLNKYSGKFNAYQRTYVLTEKVGYDLDYLFFSLKLELTRLREKSQGSQTKFLTMPLLENIQINDRDLVDQKKIASVLANLDAKIELNDKINAELEKIAKTLYDYWFVQFDFPDEDGKPYKSSGGEMVWSEELKKEIPKGWRVENINENSLTQLIKPGINFFEGKKRYLATADVIDSKINFQADLIDHESRESRANMQPVENSVWFAKMKNSKKVILLGEYSSYLADKFILSTGFAGLKCLNKYSLEYIWGCVNSVFFETLKDRLSNGATQEAINNDSMKSIPLIIPESDILKKYNLETHQIYKKMYLNGLENQKLAELRDWLLPMLMNGQVTVE